MQPIYTCYEEIKSQPTALQQTIDVVQEKSSQIKSYFDAQSPTDIIFVGCGSPFYLGESSATTWQTLLTTRARAVSASEVVQFPSAYDPPADSSPLMVVVSRSGATTETIWAAEAFTKKHPDRMLLIGCSEDSPLEAMAAHSILIPEAHETTVPQTRSFTAMYLAVQMLGAILADKQRIVDMLKQAPSEVNRIIDQWEGKASEIGSQIAINHAFYMGGGPLYGVAREGSLKMTEMSITTCSAYPFMEARHGPRSIIDEHTLLAGLFSTTAAKQEARVMADFIPASNPVSVAVTPNRDSDTGGATHHISVDLDWPDDILGLAYLPVMHLMAYYRAVGKGVNPDTSRNLDIFVELSQD